MTGQPWQIHLAVPRTRVPERGAPALYLLDGNATFPLAWHALSQLRQTRPALAEKLNTLVLIGVGYPSGLRIDTPRRYEDFTAYTPLEFRQARGSDLTTGGRDVFRSFLAGPLRDAVRQRVNLDMQAQSLLGHSMGGQFAMHVLYRQPGLFQRYIAGDPSFWWNGSALLQEQAAFIAGIQAAGGRLALPLHVLLENSGPPAQERPHPAAPLAHLQSLPLWHRQQVDASHGSMLAALVEDAIVFALGAIPSHAERWERAA
ncbi:hypothetical protein AAV94_09470 [Lampropedia cohaerens]|uniref:Esterase n=2 Tax=Lampropedia cohaerens TaxID=1610491 RepID=A0A0U1PYS2_9BURK|nr:hypothetical protein AAV94_09470 [Lampropedia cohaerens]